MYKQIIPGICVRHKETKDYGVVVSAKYNGKMLCVFKHYPSESKHVYSYKFRRYYNCEVDVVNQLEAINNLGIDFVSDMQFLLRVKIDSFMINTKTFKKTCDTYNVGLFEFMDINYLSFFKFYEYIKSNVMLETIERCALNLIRLELSNLIYTESHRVYEAVIRAAYIKNKLDR